MEPKPTHIVVNKHIVRSNKDKPAAERLPVFRCSRGKHGAPWYLHDIEGIGRYHLVYNPDDPMPCGASVWLELSQE